MATEVKTVNQISYKLNLENQNNPNDTTTRTISFDVSASADPDACADAASLFSAASMSSVFQPTNWRDSGGTEDFYICKGVTAEFIEKTTTIYDTIIPE